MSPATDPTARRFFLARTPDEGPASLAPEDADHARRVLRLGPGDELVGLDGRGGLWPLRITAMDRDGCELEPCGDPTRDPEPGSPGAALPWIEVASAIPKGGRCEDMLDRLVQLGAAGWTPLRTARSPKGSEDLTPHRLARLERRAREACKQSRRSWMPRLHPVVAPGDLVAARPGAALTVLEPGAARLLVDAGAPRGTRAAPTVLVIGPEGGWTEEEHAALLDGGATAAALGPHVLRVETAAEAALAVVTQLGVASRGSEG